MQVSFFKVLQSSRRSVVSALSLTLLGGALLTTTAHAQHIGNGQALKVTGSVLGNTADVALSSSVAGPLPGAGGNFSTGPEVKAGSLLLLDGIASLDTTLNVNASALTGSTVGGGLVVNSKAAVGNVANPSSTPTLTLGLNPLGLGNVSFLSLKAIETDTHADTGGKTSTTTIVGLTLTDLLGVPLVANGTTLTNANLTFTDSDPTVGLSIPGVATILLHEKINNGDGSRTTNGIHITLLQGSALGAVANAGITIASSTAGVTGTAAPEPGAAALILSGIPMIGVAMVRRRRRMA